jgi:hypothetical protein
LRLGHLGNNKSGFDGLLDGNQSIEIATSPKRKNHVQTSSL